MYGISFRPHKLLAVTHVDGGIDENGIPSEDTEEFTEMPCRIEPNGSARQIRFEDGTAHIYSYTVYLDRDCKAFRVGDKVRLVGLDGEMTDNAKEFRVLGFHRYQLSARLWV